METVNPTFCATLWSLGEFLSGKFSSFNHRQKHPIRDTTAFELLRVILSLIYLSRGLTFTARCSCRLCSCNRCCRSFHCTHNRTSISCLVNYGRFTDENFTQGDRSSSIFSPILCHSLVFRGVSEW